MSRKNIIREWTTKNFSIELAWEYETSPDVSWADAETLEKLESGEFLNVCFSVEVFWRGTRIGSDYLGNSVYADPADFGREHLGIRARNRADGTHYGCYLSDMVPAAIADARAELRTMRAELDAMPMVRAA